jgi:hypothetical protein
VIAGDVVLHARGDPRGADPGLAGGRIRGW